MELPINCFIYQKSFSWDGKQIVFLKEKNRWKIFGF